MKNEKVLNPANGYLFLLLILFAGLGVAYSIEIHNELFIVVSLLLFIFFAKGMVIVPPNTGKVLLLFGNYNGSVKKSGLLWINPLLSRSTLSLRARNL